VSELHLRPAARLIAAASLLSAALLHGPASSAEQTSSQADVLVWGDEFDIDGLPDELRWDYESGFVRNKERQFYTRRRAENARVEKGTLVIEARKEPYETAQYTSASLTSRASWRYGRVDVRAKLPAGRGTWPAIWTLGTNIRDVGWPACGEIDIMEHVGFDPGRIHANIHTTAYNHVKRTNKGNSIVVSKPDDDFHVYSTTWTSSQIETFVDGQRYFTFPKEEGGEAVWPFDNPQYLILNLAIGGTWGGQKGIDDGAFPARFVIDYVRVYR
jgi:beta-glucanase (GH16 family)